MKKDIPQKSDEKPIAHHPEEGSIKETIESVIIAFILAFVFRAFVVEAFVIPTGSMAPTLLGQHVSMTCPQCGYQFPANCRDMNTSGAGRGTPVSIQGSQFDPLKANCPMCAFPISQPGRSTDSGDRILVLKYIYALAEPKRWDVVVFKNPENPQENFIKRLVGLPNEQLIIVRGNVYTRTIDPDSREIVIDPETGQLAQWKIQRKTVRPKVQRAVWQPIYHSDFSPLDDGQSDLTNEEGRLDDWQKPWQIDATNKEAWSLTNNNRTFVFDPVSTDAKKVSGTLNFRYPLRHSYDFYAYNIYAYNINYDYSDYCKIVEDLRIAAVVTPANDQLDIRLNLQTSSWQFVTEVTNQQIKITGKRLQGNGQGDEDFEQVVPTKNLLPAGRPTHVEMWHVDQCVQVWVDDKLVAEFQYDNDLSDEQLASLQKKELQKSPTVSVEVSGCKTSLNSLDIDRDLYYTQTWESDALGTHGKPVTISRDRFFCMGDNSPQSKDSRLLKQTNPWIKYNLAHRSGGAVTRGVIPRELMIGRAFFVYFPAAHRFKPTSMWLVPDFGKMRFIR